MHSRLLAVAAALAATAATPVLAAAPAAAATGNGPLGVARDSAPVILQGDQIAAWAAPAATTQGLAAPHTNGGNSYIDHTRSAHNGYLLVPPTPPDQLKVDPDTVAAYSWVGGKWKQVPVQVDQRFPYFLANAHSDFGFYSGTDEELTYAWAPDAHDTGEEAWKKVFGECQARYANAPDEQAPPGTVDQPSIPAPPGPANGVISGPPDNYTKAMQDPQPLFDADDELAFMARDAGGMAPAGQATPPGTANGQTVTITDPLDPSTVRFVYLFTQTGGSRYDANNGYVQMTRDADADRWNDQYAYDDDDPMRIGNSNSGYGPNLPGTVCRTSPGNLNRFPGVADGDPRHSDDRTPLDGMTVTTPTYQLHADGRWLVRSLKVTKPGTTFDYGPNVIARWKGRAFQQNPDSTISVVGFEDEQVNWENNSALLGWRSGPVRAIREIWGADSGTNVTKTEYYYRDADVFNYHTRVHPIPPDGLYTDWAYRYGVATRYYNLNASGGVPVDGIPDAKVGEVDEVPVTGQKAYTNVCDPTTQLCSALDAPEEVAGPGFGLVYEFEMTSPTNLVGNSAVVPYYRDDACFDDGTGDSPVQRPWPGESSTDDRVRQGYVDYWHARGMPVTGNLDDDYAQLKCQPEKASDPSVPDWQKMPFQGAIAEHGLHFFITQDSDNTFSPKPTDEVDGQQWRFEVPMESPTNVLVPYGANVSAKLVAVAVPYGSASPSPTLPEVPLPVLLPAIGAAVAGVIGLRRRRARER